MEEKTVRIPKKITTTYIFESDIEKVWELLMKHDFLIKSLSGDRFISYKFTKENKFDIIGSEITVICKTYTFYLKVTNLLVENFYKQIKYHVSFEEKEYFYEHDLIIILISDTINGTTILKWECEIAEDQQKLNTLTLEGYKQNRLTQLKIFSEYLNNKRKEFSQYESIMINASRKEVWDIISNWKVLKSISTCVADDVEYNGDHLKEGSSLKLTFNTKLNVVCYFKIVKVINELNSQDWEYVMELYHSIPKIPHQEIRFSIVFLGSRKCFLTFEHLYKETLDIKMLNNISIDKKSVLAAIKNYS